MLNKTTGVFTYTPTAAQRIQAALPGGVDPRLLHRDGLRRARRRSSPPSACAIEPTQLTDIGALPAGEGALGSAVTNTRAYITNRRRRDGHGDRHHQRGRRRQPSTSTIAPGRDRGHAATARKVYVASQADQHSMSVINADHQHRHVPHTARRTHPAAAWPISPDGKTLYVTTTSYDDDGLVTGSTITKISTTTNKVSGTVN